MHPLFVIAIVLGLTSSLHCIGMCGPIAMAVPLNRRNNRTILWGLLQYNGGRILTYSLLGLLIGTIGLSIRTLGILQWTSIVSGLVLILFAWRKQLSTRIKFQFQQRLTGFIGRSIGKVVRSGSVFRLPLLGALNGLLPCGMVFIALTNAILTGDMWLSALSMAIFGLGTLPAMLLTGFFAHRITGSIRTKFTHLTPYVLSLVGILVVLRGMNLDIPYISPKVSQHRAAPKTPSTEDHANEELEVSCCHPARTCH